METEYKCKVCNGLGIDPHVIDNVVYEGSYGKTEQEVIERFKTIDFVEDDGCFCYWCHGSGTVDWVKNCMGVA